MKKAAVTMTALGLTSLVVINHLREEPAPRERSSDTSSPSQHNPQLPAPKLSPNASLGRPNHLDAAVLGSKANPTPVATSHSPSDRLSLLDLTADPTQAPAWIQQLHEGETHVTLPELQTFAAFLENSPTTTPNSNWQTYWWTFDEAVSDLRKSQPDSALHQALWEFTQKPSLDAVIKEYAVQHLGHLLSSPEVQAEALESRLWILAGGSDRQAGAALLALHHRRDHLTQAPAEDLLSLAEQLSQNPQADLAARTTATALLAPSPPPATSRSAISTTRRPFAQAVR